MRAKTKGKHEIRKRFALVIGVAAVGVMALGAQTAAPAQAVVKYDTTLTITHEGCCTEPTTLWHGSVRSDRKECMGGREVTLFKQQPGADRQLHPSQSVLKPKLGFAVWGGGGLLPWRGGVYARVTPKVRDGFVCGADRSRTIKNGNICFEGPSFCPTDYGSRIIENGRI